MSNTELVLDTCLTAGKIMIENGSEISRVDDTMQRIAKNAGISTASNYVTITGVMMSVRGQNATQIEPITRRTIDLEKVAAVNRLSRQFAAKQIDLTYLNQALTQLDHVSTYFPLWLQLIGAGLVSGPLMIVFRHTFVDLVPTILIGILGYLVFYMLNRYWQVRFLSEFGASLIISLATYAAVHFGIGSSINNIIIGALMPLVPGVPLTNAVRDTLAGNLISGPARAVEALISACAIGFGVAVVIRFL